MQGEEEGIGSVVEWRREVWVESKHFVFEKLGNGCGLLREIKGKRDFWVKLPWEKMRKVGEWLEAAASGSSSDFKDAEEEGFLECKSLRNSKGEFGRVVAGNDNKIGSLCLPKGDSGTGWKKVSNMLMDSIWDSKHITKGKQNDAQNQISYRDKLIGEIQSNISEKSCLLSGKIDNGDDRKRIILELDFEGFNIDWKLLEKKVEEIKNLLTENKELASLCCKVRVVEEVEEGSNFIREEVMSTVGEGVSSTGNLMINPIEEIVLSRAPVKAGGEGPEDSSVSSHVVGQDVIIVGDRSHNKSEIQNLNSLGFTDGDASKREDSPEVKNNSNVSAVTNSDVGPEGFNVGLLGREASDLFDWYCGMDPKVLRKWENKFKLHLINLRKGKWPIKLSHQLWISGLNCTTKKRKTGEIIQGVEESISKEIGLVETVISPRDEVMGDELEKGVSFDILASVQGVQSDSHTRRVVLWMYKDPWEGIQGPFRKEDLHKWKFPPQFRVWESTKSVRESILLSDALAI